MRTAAHPAIRAFVILLVLISSKIPPWNVGAMPEVSGRYPLSAVLAMWHMVRTAPLMVRLAEGALSALQGP